MPDSRRTSKASSADFSSTSSSLGLFISDDDLLALANDDVDFWMSLHATEGAYTRRVNTPPLAQPVRCELSTTYACGIFTSPSSCSPSPPPPAKPLPIPIPLPRLSKLELGRKTVVEPLHSPELVSPLFPPPILAESLPSLASSSSTSTCSAPHPASPLHGNDTPPNSFSPDEPSPRKLPFPPLDSPPLEFSYVTDIDLHLLAGIVAQEARQRRAGQRRWTEDVDAEVKRDEEMGRVKCWVEHRRGRRARVA
ncbi:hypothetical protein NBRC10513_002997 [Rhodotorula toruloides]